jgi:hypothetical protein
MAGKADMDLQWVKIKSWHAIRPHDHFGPTTYCSRDAEGHEVRDDRPTEGICKICEVAAARNDDPEVE